MEKDTFYLASTGRKVTFGDVINGRINQEGVYARIKITLDKNILPLLLEFGILVTEPPKPDITIATIIKRLSKKLDWSTNKVEACLNDTATIMPMAAFNIIARELAILLDEKYPDHINDSDDIYCISTIDGRIHKLCKACIKNYRNFAAFRTMEDAKLACHVLRGFLKSMFSGK